MQLRGGGVEGGASGDGSFDSTAGAGEKGFGRLLR